MLSVWNIIILLIAVVIFKWNTFVEWIKFKQLLRRLPTLQYAAYPVVGHLYLLPKDPKEIFKFWTQVCKNQLDKGVTKFLIWRGIHPYVLINSPESAQVLLKSSVLIEKTRFYRMYENWLGSGLVTASGKQWHKHRQMITPSFHFNILQKYLEIMDENAMEMTNIFADKCSAQEPIELLPRISLTALDIIMETAMGKSVNAKRNLNSNYLQCTRRLVQAIYTRIHRPWLHNDFLYRFSSNAKEERENMKVLHQFSGEVIMERMEEVRRKAVVGKKRQMFLDTLLAAQSEDGGKLSFAEVRDEVETFIFAGHDTTATSMTWVVYMVGLHPDVQEKLHKEVDGIFTDDIINNDDLGRLEYLEKVIKESLRIFPTIPWISRKITEDVEIDGHILPKGVEATVFIHSIHHHPDHWSNPHQFDPERFSKENSAKRHPFAYIPFSGGPRNCIGRRFAMQEMKILLGRILHQFDITSHDRREDVRVSGVVTLKPATPLNISLTKRR